jgi:hypothetical protein
MVRRIYVLSGGFCTGICSNSVPHIPLQDLTMWTMESIKSIKKRKLRMVNQNSEKAVILHHKNKPWRCRINGPIESPENLQIPQVGHGCDHVAEPQYSVCAVGLAHRGMSKEFLGSRPAPILHTFSGCRVFNKLLYSFYRTKLTVTLPPIVHLSWYRGAQVPCSPTRYSTAQHLSIANYRRAWSLLF